MSILSDVKSALRVTLSLTDGEIQAYIDAALFDMENKGVRAEFLSDSAADGDYMPIVKVAVINYCKAQYGRDVDASERNANLASYRSIVTSFLNGRQNRLHEGEWEE